MSQRERRASAGVARRDDAFEYGSEGEGDEEPQNTEKFPSEKFLASILAQQFEEDDAEQIELIRQGLDDEDSDEVSWALSPSVFPMLLNP